uniref:NADP-dependent oxidoreductase domain-containing protein n=4 Tax=Aegilops tauschii subsp. strangulata TaxID=200361 RepID=A0A453DTP7_AEGTS
MPKEAGLVTAEGTGNPGRTLGAARRDARRPLAAHSCPPLLRPPPTYLLPQSLDSAVRERETAMARHFLLNTGAKIPSVGLGTWQ